MFEDFFRHFGDPMSRFRDDRKPKHKVEDEHSVDDVNPSTGLPMMGDVDAGGNPYGSVGDSSLSFDFIEDRSH